MEQEQRLAATPPAVSSFMTRATNVFSSPGELYAEVAGAPVQTSSWSVPYILSLLLTALVTFSLFYNTTLRQQIIDMQQESMRKSVAEGRMTQEQMDRTLQGMESGGTVIFMVFGAGTGMVVMSLMFFGGTLVVWLVTKIVMKFQGSYKKMLEVFGLSTLIGVLGTIVYILMMNFFNTMHASPGLALLLMNSFDPASFSHRLMAQVNVFTLWQTAVLGIGMARIAGKTAGTGVGIALVLWFVWVIASSAMNFGMR